jgi:hypothetical protein
LSIRNAIESYRVFIESSTKVKNFSLTNDLVQLIGSGYLKNIKVLEYTEQGRTICEKISGTVVPEQIEKVLKREVEKRTRKVEEKGIDNNGYLKILRVYEEDEWVETNPLHLKGVPYQSSVSESKPVIKTKINIVCKVLKKVEYDWNTKGYTSVFLEFFDPNGEPIETVQIEPTKSYGTKFYPKQIVRFSSFKISHSYKVWLYVKIKHFPDSQFLTGVMFKLPVLMSHAL